MDTMTLRRAAVLSRWLLEAVALLSWFSNRLPAALALCGAVLRRLPAVVFHPASAFLLGNLIVVTLLVKPGGHTADAPPSSAPPPPTTAGDGPAHDGYRSYFSDASPPRLQREEEGDEEEEVVRYEDKAVSVCLDSTTSTTTAPPTDYTGDTAAPASPEECQQRGLSLLRTRSSELPLAAVAKVGGSAEKLLRRSDTDVGARRSAAETWWQAEEEENEEEAEGEGGRRRRSAAAASNDNEEFRRRIDAFISKQLRFIEREEESLLLASKGAPVAFAVAGGGVRHRHRR